MNYQKMLLICLAVLCCVAENAQTYNVSINPQPIMTSYYDYMIGGYNATPVQVVPDAQGGGIRMAFHGKNTSTALRKSYLAYLDTSGILQSLDSFSVEGSANGYPSLAVDEDSGIIFTAWHNQIGTDINTSVYGAFGSLGNPMPVFSSTIAGESYMWPIVKFGQSPVFGMRRLYVLAKRTVSSTIQVPEIAYCDFNPALITNDTVLTWSYLSIPELEDWAASTTITRRASYAFVIGNDGSIYLVGNHTTNQIDPEAYIDEPNLDVFKCDNFGLGTWSRTSIHAEQEPSMPYSELENPLLADIQNSSHFNAVLDRNGIIHFPQLASYGWMEGNTTYYLTDTQSLRHIEYNTGTETLRIDDLYPQGVSPHELPAYTPWDINEDGVIDQYVNGVPFFPRTWPFPYWDSTVHSNAMFYHYNKLMMTEPNQYGWMATVWQDSNKARVTQENPPGFPCSEIYISLSPDNGWTWLEPFVLSPDYQAVMTNLKPMWVYPANKLTVQSLEGGILTCRLYLMIYSDSTWGAYNVEGSVGPNDGGQVMYMAVDISMPITSAHEETSPQAVVSLKPNYPNPFNTSTQIKYNLPKADKVNLSIYNTKGQLIKTLVNSNIKAGEQSITWDGTDVNKKRVASGLYLYKLSTNSKIISHKMLMLK